MADAEAALAPAPALDSWIGLAADGTEVEAQVLPGFGADGKPMSFQVSRVLPPADGAPWRHAADLAAEADLVFRGTVTGIDYQLSEPDPVDGAQMPYTFVTYNVTEVLAGAADGEQITLRFVGGLNVETRRYTVRSHTPQFDLGDEDILFVQGNGVELCPLVGEADGRLRIIAGQVYTDSGNAVLADADGDLRIGKKSRLDAVETTQVLGRELRTSSSHRAVEGPGDASSAEDVLEVARLRAGRLQTVGRFRSVDPTAPIIETQF